MITSNDFNPGPRHNHKCPCEACEGNMSPEDVNKRTDEFVEKYGFCVHAVMNAGPYVNIHTHGFERSWNHPDFQIVLPFHEDLVSKILWDLADQVKKGRVFKAGEMADRVIKNYPVKIVAAEETGHNILRVVFPDKNGLFPGDPKVDKLYGGQEAATV